MQSKKKTVIFKKNVGISILFFNAITNIAKKKITIEIAIKSRADTNIFQWF